MSATERLHAANQIIADQNRALATVHAADAPQSESAAIVHMIERAARDPSVDIDKMQRLLELRRSVKADEAKAAFARSMTAAQTEMRAVARDSNNPQTRSRYASYLALDAALKPIYTKHGFSLTFDTGNGAPDQYVRVVCDLLHDGGHTREYHIDMPADGKGAKGGDVMTKTHAAGSAITYGQRYLLKMIFNVATGEREDDGNGASADTGVVNDKQADEIRSLLTATKSDLDRFLKWTGAESVSDIPASKYADCIAMLKAKKKKGTAQ